jgi:hypothetical protein
MLQLHRRAFFVPQKKPFIGKKSTKLANFAEQKLATTRMDPHSA